MSKSITFTSTIFHGDDKSKISFKSPVTIGKYQEFVTFDFIEPQNKVMNRIEVATNKINIFAGLSTINLKLDKIVSIQYQTPHGILFLNSYMNKLNMDDMPNIEFTYSLSKDNEIVGEYNIQLQIKGK